MDEPCARGRAQAKETCESGFERSVTWMGEMGEEKGSQRAQGSVRDR